MFVFSSDFSVLLCQSVVLPSVQLALGLGVLLVLMPAKAKDLLPLRSLPLLVELARAQAHTNTHSLVYTLQSLPGLPPVCCFSSRPGNPQDTELHKAAYKGPFAFRVIRVRSQVLHQLPREFISLCVSVCLLPERRRLGSCGGAPRGRRACGCSRRPKREFSWCPDTDIAPPLMPLSSLVLPGSFSGPPCTVPSAKDTGM